MQLSTALNLPNRQVSAGGFGYGASLALDLTSGTQTLDPRITFSRTSNATVTGPDGLIAYAPHNLLTYSEQFDNAAWTKTNAAVTANTTAAPDGTSTADTLTDDATLGQHQVNQIISVTSGTSYTFSAYVKMGTAQYARLSLGGAAMTFLAVVFDLQTGTTNTPASSTITSVGNGWFRVTATSTASSTGNGSFSVGITNAGGTTYSGTGSTLFIWGAQLNVGALQPYYPTTVKNLLGYTQEFDNAAWSKVEATIAANSTAAPDGSVTADTFAESTATTAHFTTQSATVISGTVYTLSTYAKNNGRAVQLAFGTGNFGSNAFANFDLSSGVVGSVGSAATATIESVGNGWYRCAIAAPATTSGSAALVIYGATTPSASRAPSYTGDGTSGIYIWGAQLSDSASLDQYVYNPVAAPAAAAYYGPRFDYDPVTLAPKGLLIEEQRTNLLLQSEAVDNASWSKSGILGVTSNATASPDGLVDADLVVPTATTVQHFVGQTVTGAAHNFSTYVKAGGYSSVILFFTVHNSYVTFDLSTQTVTETSGTITSSSITAVGNGWYRVSVATSLTTHTEARVYVTVGGTYATRTVAGDGTSGIYIWGAQIEVGAFPTSYIPTTTAAATRAVDGAVMQGANFSNWYNAVEGSFYSSVLLGQPPALSNSAAIYCASDNTASNRILVLCGTGAGGNINALVTAGGVAQAQTINGGLSTAGAYLYANAYKANDFASVVNGGAAVTDTSGTIPVVDRLYFGATAVGSPTLNGHISRIAYFPRRLSNTELQGITS